LEPKLKVLKKKNNFDIRYKLDKSIKLEKKWCSCFWSLLPGICLLMIYNLERNFTEISMVRFRAEF
jgi:hypothetical protein